MDPKTDDTAIEPYDFDRPAALARKHKRSLEVAFEAFTRQWATHLTEKTRVRLSIVADHVDLTSYRDYTESLPSSTTVAVCDVEGYDESALIQVPTSTSLGWVVQMVGGRTSETDLAGRDTLTTIERSLLTNIMRGVVDALDASLVGLYPSGMTLTSLQSTPQFAQLASPTDLVVVARLTIRTPDGEANATVALPSALVMAQLSSAAPADDPETEAANITYQVSETPLEVAVRFAPLTMRSGEVLGLSVGDTIPLLHPSSRPLDVVIGDTPLATGTLAAVGTRCACVVVDVPGAGSDSTAGGATPELDTSTDNFSEMETP